MADEASKSMITFSRVIQVSKRSNLLQIHESIFLHMVKYFKVKAEKAIEIYYKIKSKFYKLCLLKKQNLDKNAFSECPYCQSFQCGEYCELPQIDKISFIDYLKLDKSRRDEQCNSVDLILLWNRYPNGKSQENFESQVSLTDDGTKVNLKLEDCLTNYFGKPNTNSSRNCSYCVSSLQPLMERSLVAFLPNILIIHFNRFEQDANNGFKVKEKALVNFPLDQLNMKSFINSSSKENTLLDDSNTIYELISVVNYEEVKNNAGENDLFYWTYSRNWMKNNEWFSYKDEVVEPVKDLQTIVSRNAFIFFYQCKS